MTTTIAWNAEFARVIQCTTCTSATDRKLLRDLAENVPQPGWVGSNYNHARVLLVGQNPGTPKSLADADRPYTNALRALKDNPTEENHQALVTVLQKFVPQWPVHGNYFPLVECGLTLQDIAYCNVVRCRTQNDRPPNKALAQTCIAQHFSRWLALLSPRVVVFVGKWAADHAVSEVQSASIPSAFMNRQRSLSSEDRAANRHAVVQLVRELTG
jgi:uracil-DNA glycosylase